MARLLNPGLAPLVALIAASSAAQTPPTTQKREITFNVSIPLEFKGRVVSGSLRQSDISELLDLPVRNGDTDPDHRYGVEMTRPDKSTFMVYTCRQWKKAQADKAYSATTYDMAMEGFLIRTCGLLFDLQNAKLPLKSFVTNPRVTLANLNLLPAEMLASMPKNESASLRGKTIADVVPKRDIEKASPEILTVNYGGFHQSFWEAARADFNSDGIEDILVVTGGRAEGGTMGYADYFVLTRTRPSGPLKVFRTGGSP